MKLKLLYPILSFIFAINLFVVTLFLAFVPPAMNREFYYNQFSINQSYQKAFTTEATLNQLLDHTLDYTYGNKPNFQYQITLLDGRTIDAFTETEVLHMIDVQNLFLAGRALTLFSLLSLVLIGSWFLINPTKFKRSNFKVMRNTIIGILLFTLVILGFASTDFSNAFVIFHQIFFSNDLWILYATDYLIIMLPEVLFFRLAIRIIISLVIYLVLILGVLTYLGRNAKRKVKA